MNEYPASFEQLKNYLFISESARQNLATIKAKIAKNFAVAFLVTSNFEIFIGTTGRHADIYSKFQTGGVLTDPLSKRALFIPQPAYSLTPAPPRKTIP